jgi:autotransporter-associated beta strand protein
MNTTRSLTLWLIAFSVTFLSLGAAQAQTTYDWNSGAPDGNWKQGAGGHRWGFDLWDEPPAGGGTVLRFNNNTHVVMTNNVDGYSVHGLIFGSSATTSRTLNGNSLTFFDNGGNGPFIRNESSTAHTINLALIGDNSGDPLRVQLDGGAGGNLTFGSTINNNGSSIEILGSAAGAKTVTFQGVISGSGGFYANHVNVTTIFDAQNTMTGQLTINAGTVRLGGAGATFGGNSQNIRIGTNAVLDLNGISTTVGSVGEEGNNDGGTISLGSATLTVGGNDYETFQNGISGTGSLVKSGSGTLNLYGSQTYSGSTTVNGGILSSDVAMSTASVTVGGGTFRTTAANVLGDSVAVTVNSGTYSVGGSDTIGVLSGSGGTVTVTNGTLTTAFNSASNSFSGTLTGAGAFTKAGSGTLTLAGSGQNTISGGVTVSAGELVLGKSANTAAVGGAVTVSSGASLRTTAANQFNNNLVTVDGSLDMDGNGQSLALRGEGTVILGNATLTNNVTVSDNFSGSITGAGGVVKSGNGAAIFSGTSDYDGSTAITGGTLEIQSATALGSTNGATTVSDGAILKVFSGSSMAVAESITINGTTGDGSLQNVGGNNTISGNITLGLNSRIGSIGGGSLNLSGAVNGTNRVLYIGGPNNTTISGGLSGTGNTEGGTTTSLYKDGAGTLTLSGNNAYSGDTRVVVGTLTVASGGNLGNGDSDVFLANGTTLNINANTTVDSVQESTNNVAGGVIAIGTGATLTVDGANKGQIFQNSISGAGGLTVAASGTTELGLYGTQSYAGATVVSGGTLSTAVAMSTAGVTVGGGTFKTTAADILGNSTAVTVNSGTYSVGGSDTIGVLSGSGGTVNITTNTATLTTSFNSASTNYAGAITGAGGFAKAGTGTLTLSGANTKSGANTVSGGKLEVQSGASLAGATTVSSGATLDADGTLSGAVTVNSGGKIMGGGSVGSLTINGVLAPGNSAGTITATNGATWNEGGSYEWEIFDLGGPAGTGWDLLSVTGGTLDLNGITTAGGFTINLITLQSNNATQGALTGFTSTATYTDWMIASAPTISGFSAGLFTLDSSLFVGATGTFAIEQRAIDDGQGLFITYTGGGSEPIPEPGTWAAAALLAGAAGYMRWRRRRVGV